MLRDWITNSLYACGTAELPKTLFTAGRQWMLVRTFKHDFFAATGLYAAADNQISGIGRQDCIVLKVGRLVPFFGIPLAWLGRYLTGREYKILERIQTIDQVPHLVGRYGANGFTYRFIEGRSLDEKPELPDAFFDDLKSLLHRIHTAGICYLDFNKRGNILMGADKRPYLIDFQISILLKWPTSLRHRLQREDDYHLLKHKRRFRPDLLTETETLLLTKKSLAIRTHRFLTVPLRKLRRRILGLLYRKQLLKHDASFEPTPENDPTRFGS